MYFCRHVYITAPSCHLPIKMRGVMLENSKFHIQPIVLSHYHNPLNISV